MKAIGVIVLAVVASTCFTGTSCNPINTWFEPNCDGYIALPENRFACSKMMYQPVCGTDGKTYSNECELCLQKIMSKGELKIKHRDACSVMDDCYGFTEVCTREYKPVCGSDGVTYSNKCMFCDAKQGKGKANLLVLFEGQCKPKDYQDGCERYEDMCTYEHVDYRPVCGSDGVTYNNKCIFCRTKRQTKGNLLIVSEGECTPKNYQHQDGCEIYSDFCGFNNRPVCGSDGVTYGNKCDFCRTKRQMKANLLIVSEGECTPKKS